MLLSTALSRILVAWPIQLVGFLFVIYGQTRATMDYYLLVPNDVIYPLTDFIIGIGFFFVLFLEKIVMRINKRRVQVQWDSRTA